VDLDGDALMNMRRLKKFQVRGRNVRESANNFALALLMGKFHVFLMCAPLLVSGVVLLFFHFPKKTGLHTIHFLQRLYCVRLKLHQAMTK